MANSGVLFHWVCAPRFGWHRHPIVTMPLSCAPEPPRPTDKQWMLFESRLLSHGICSQNQQTQRPDAQTLDQRYLASLCRSGFYRPNTGLVSNNSRQDHARQLLLATDGYVQPTPHRTTHHKPSRNSIPIWSPKDPEGGQSVRPLGAANRIAVPTGQFPPAHCYTAMICGKDDI